MMTERWLPVPGYERYYEVSDQGGVRRILKSGATRHLTPYPNPKGYLLVRLSGAGAPVYGVGVHRLVLMAFMGTPPSPAHQGNHLDGIKTNNALSNLEWSTPQENVLHAYANGLGGDHSGERNGRAKLTADQALEIRSLRGTATQREIAERYGVSQSLISAVMCGEVWAEQVAA